MKKIKKSKKKELFTYNNAIILLIIIVIFAILKASVVPQKTGLAKDDLSQDAEIVLDKLTNGKVSLIRSNELIERQIQNLDKMDYEEIKNLFGVKNDFCIYFEDITGNAVRINNMNLGIGSNKISINGEPCN